MLIFRIFILTLLAFSSVFGGQKVVLFNDTSAWYHWGCTGTSTALKEHIQKLGFELEAFPITLTYSLREVPPFEEFDSPERFERFQEANKEVLEQIQSSAAVVITGEGTIHELRIGPRNLLYLAHVSKKFLGKHVEIINHSAYPKDDPVFAADFWRNSQAEKEKNDQELPQVQMIYKALDFWKNPQAEKERNEQELSQAQMIYKTLYSELDFVAIREPFSQEVMDNIGVSSTLSFDCLPLYIRDHYHNTKQVHKKTVVVAGSVAFTESGGQQICRYLE